MTYVKINGIQYPAIVSGKLTDRDWDDRPSKSIKLEMTHDEALNVFTDGAEWSIVQQEEFLVEEPVYKVGEDGELVLDENGEPIQIDTQSKIEIKEHEFDNSDYNLAGDVTDHRDGTVTVKMGKLTELEEAYELMLGGI